MFLMWLGEQITERGIGNGISIIIFAGIVAGLPSAIGGLLELVNTGAMHELTALFIVSLVFAVTALVVFRGARATQDSGELREASGWQQGLWWAKFTPAAEAEYGWV
jgi:hypothetical protein